MDPSFDIPDSTDWLDTPLSLVAPLESSLRCQVCKDFFDNPVITSCSHTFCSLCIRRCLSSEGKCPVCRSSDQETKLRRNWAVQELVEAFNNARPNVLDLARKARDGGSRGHEEETEEHTSKKRKVELPQVEGEEFVPEGVRTRSRSKRADDRPEIETVDLVEDSQDEEDYVPEDGLVACPICSRRMKNEAVFVHLDTCNGDPAPPRQISFGSLPMPPAPRRQALQTSTNNPPERLPAINYSIIKENVLRKKLRDLGIPNWGPRPLLQRRHTEWMNIWNANCDSKFPKQQRELLRELDAWERTQGGNANPSSIDSANAVMGKGFNATAWSSSHDDDFKRLIADARKKSDAVHRPAPQEPVASNEPEMSSFPERFPEREERPTAPVLEAPAPSSDINGMGSEPQPIQNGNIIVPPE